MYQLLFENNAYNESYYFCEIKLILQKIGLSDPNITIFLEKKVFLCTSSIFCIGLKEHIEILNNEEKREYIEFSKEFVCNLCMRMINDQFIYTINNILQSLTSSKRKHKDIKGYFLKCGTLINIKHNAVLIQYLKSKPIAILTIFERDIVNPEGIISRFRAEMIIDKSDVPLICYAIKTDFISDVFYVMQEMEMKKSCPCGLENYFNLIEMLESEVIRKKLELLSEIHVEVVKKGVIYLPCNRFMPLFGFMHFINILSNKNFIKCYQSYKVYNEKLCVLFKKYFLQYD